MLVLAMEFSRISEARQAPATERKRSPAKPATLRILNRRRATPSKRNRDPQPVINWESLVPTGRYRPDQAGRLLRKEVIQPHLPVRLPCYDFTPIADPTFDSSLLAVGPLASGVANFRGVTGGVYKARERIHPGSADPGLLATPTSWSRVADSNPN